MRRGQAVDILKTCLLLVELSDLRNEYIYLFDLQYVHISVCKDDERTLVVPTLHKLKSSGVEKERKEKERACYARLYRATINLI